METIIADANLVAARAAYCLSEVAAIYPITPSTPMAEKCDEWAGAGKVNAFGQPLRVVEMQSEGGAAGAMHGALSAGALTTTFTASQGLLLMHPDLCKMAGELLPGVLHVAARALSYHALSIFGDHSDVMAIRSCGVGMLCASGVQEAADLAVVAHLAALRGSVPMVHFFDGFRTSHEIQKVEVLSDREMTSLLPMEALAEFRSRGLNPEHPHQQGTAQNPDIYFQGREAANPWYNALPGIVASCMAQVEALTGRKLGLFTYEGDEKAERVLVLMGSAGETAAETAKALQKNGERVGVLRVRLYRPFDARAMLALLPETVKRVAVLDRTKEAGAIGEPLFLDVSAAIKQSGRNIRVIGGRYGLGSKEFSPAMARAVFDHLALDDARMPFTVGIEDDVTGLSLRVREEMDILPSDTLSCKFFGLGSDGTVGANKAAVQLLGAEAGREVQAYFAYDSKKSGGLTVSHLRLSREKIRAPYLIGKADLLSVHQPTLLELPEVSTSVKDGGRVLLNLPEASADELPEGFLHALKNSGARGYWLDAAKIAEECGLPGRINVAMQTAFFLLLGEKPREEVVELLIASAKKTYASKGEEVVSRNERVIRRAADALRQLDVSQLHGKRTAESHPMEGGYAAQFIRPILEQRGNELPVSALDPRGHVPTGTSRLEKRGIAGRVPRWVPERCIQCGLCSLVCPHGCIRPFYPEEGAKVPEGFVTLPAKGREHEGRAYRVQVSPMDCTGCCNCEAICPARGKALLMTPIAEMGEEQALWTYAESLAERHVEPVSVAASQVNPPLFQFSGACAGCGETPYLKLLTQLFGPRMVIANATGCSSIYAGSAPTCPYMTDQRGRGPAWGSSLFEDNAEFGLGIALALRQRRERLIPSARALAECPGELGQAAQGWLEAYDDGARSAEASSVLLARCQGEKEEAARFLRDHSDQLTKKSVWIIGGDGWAYDIGFGGLDHVLATGEDVNVLVLDTEVYSNTGGQASKATPAGATARFASAGKETAKKDLGMMAMTYGHVYVAQVSMGADPGQLLKALREAEAYPGPSLVIAYAPCIAHGVDMADAQALMKEAVRCGYWLLYRYRPQEHRLMMDSREPREDMRAFLMRQGRFAQLARRDPERAEALFRRCEEDARNRRDALTRLMGKKEGE